MNWARRLALGAGFAVAAVVVVPGVATAADPGCSTTGSTIAGSMTPPTPNCPVSPPTVSGNNQTASLPSSEPSTAGSSTGSTAGSSTSSLPFTGADIGELAAIGGVAVAAGYVLARRRRTVQA